MLRLGLRTTSRFVSPASPSAWEMPRPPAFSKSTIRSVLNAAVRPQLITEIECPHFGSLGLEIVDEAVRSFVGRVKMPVHLEDAVGLARHPVARAFRVRRHGNNGCGLGLAAQRHRFLAALASPAASASPAIWSGSSAWAWPPFIACRWTLWLGRGRHFAWNLRRGESGSKQEGAHQNAERVHQRVGDPERHNMD